ncbi:hypothetical protein DCS_01115 [Drechmeria coniospora]|uniref:Uncharacterized protein n=1 Tax=Drechmeria coniospora TaxID=98403 RepID=A0A151GSD6_DRECN|nr:hypothetical protein DCS_01115 [Drechmeria coniospora]KYK59981.1 hypothetical protein DCS_01115 [Drechmeria coniospora]
MKATRAYLSLACLAYPVLGMIFEVPVDHFPIPNDFSIAPADRFSYSCVNAMASTCADKSGTKHDDCTEACRVCDKGLTKRHAGLRLSYGICSPSAGLCRCRWEQESDQDTLEFMELFHGEKDGKKYKYQPVVWSVKPDVERYDLRPRDVIKEDCRHGLATSCQMSSEAMGNADCSEVMPRKCDCTWKDRKEHALQYLTVEDKKNKYGDQLGRDEPVWRWVDVAENPEPEQGSLTPRWRLTKEHDRVDTDCISAMFSTCQKQTILFGGAEDAGCLAAVSANLLVFTTISDVFYSAKVARHQFPVNTP